MAGIVVRYDPERLADLRHRCLVALQEIRAIRSDDPAASSALTAIHLARDHFEQAWLPLVERILASDALTTWTPSALGPSASGLHALVGRWSPWVSGLAARTGAALGHDLADKAREVIDDGDPDDVDDLLAALAANAGDAAAVRSLFADLGGRDTGELLVCLGTMGGHADEALALAITVRTTLSAASRRAGFPTRFAPELVEGLVDELDDDEANPAVAMAFLFDDAHFGTGFLVATTSAIVDAELAAGGDDPASGFTLWPPATGFTAGSVLRRALDTDGDGNDSSEDFRATDPLHAVLEDVARDGDAGRAIFTDDRLAGYLFGVRDFQRDGMRSLAAAATTAAAGADVVPGADVGLLHDAAEVASAFVNLVGRRDAVSLEMSSNPAVSASVAIILGQHMFAVHNAVLTNDPMRQPGGVVIPIRDRTRGEGYVAEGAHFDDRALSVMTDLAVESEDGVAILRAALDLHQVTQASAGAAELAAETPADANAFLEEAVADSARLEAFFIAHVGHVAEAEGRSKDAKVRFWIDVASYSLGAASTPLKAVTGPLTTPVIGSTLGPAAAVAKDLMATHEARAAHNASSDAEASVDQLTYVWYRSLYRAGVIAPDLPAVATVHGELVPWADFQALDDAAREIVRNTMEESTGRNGLNIDANRLRDAFKVQQAEIYHELD